MQRQQTTTPEDLGEVLASTMLLRKPPGAFYVVVLREDGAGEYLRYIERDDLEAARLTAAEWRAQGHQVAIWQRVE